jgi:outer membrane protein TolC
MARRSKPAERIQLLIGSAALLLAAQACSADSYKKDADSEVGEILSKKQRELFNKATGFTVEQARDTLRAQMLVALEQLRATRLHEREKEFGPVPEPGGVEKKLEEATAATRQEIEEIRRVRAEHISRTEKAHESDLTPFEATDPPLLPVRTIGLGEAIEIAADNNRDYQQQKELVYTSALNLTFERYLFQSHFDVSTEYNWQSVDVDGTRTRQGTLTSSLSMTRTLATGGLLVFDFTNTLLKTFTGVDFSNGKSHTTSSLMDITFTQPLLRGFGADIVEEPLVQSERSVYYQLRAFERFRQDFAVSTAREYMTLLSLLDRANNARTSYLQLIDVQEQSTAKGRVGKLPEIQVSQARQAELSARNTWFQLQRGYQDAVDQFKVTLGLPMDSNLAPDPADLEALRAQNPGPSPLGETEALAIALDHRYDYQTELDRVDDSKRQVKVTADALRAALSVSGGISIPTERDTVFALQGGRTNWNAGVALDLPIDRLAERNNYRAALIALDAQQRATTLAEDQVRQDVRNDVRRLAQVLETIRLQQAAVAVAVKREASTALQLAMGRSQIRDYTDAVDSLNNARNALTQALIDHRIGEYELSRDVGLLELGTNGIVAKFRPELPSADPQAKGAGAPEGEERPACAEPANPAEKKPGDGRNG